MNGIGIALVLVMSAEVAVWAEDWPQFRGVNRDAVWHERALLKEFPADGLKVRWRRSVGPGYSSPVIAAGRVFVSDSQLMKPVAKERLLCFEETTGKPLWTHAYEVKYEEWAFTPGQESGPCATPIADAGKVYMIGANGHVHCLDTRNGAVVWENNLGKQYKIAEMSCRPSPLIEGKLLILFVGGKPDATVVALNNETGKEVWKSLEETVSNSSPLMIEAGGKRQLIVWTDESVASLNPANGDVYWREAMTTSNNDAIPTPVVLKHWLLIGGLMLELKSDKPMAEVLWPETRAVPKRILSNTSTALLQGDHVYSAKSNGEFVCLEAATGKQVWQTNSVTDLQNGASVHITATGDGVFLFTNQGDLIRAQLTPAGYHQISRARLLEPTSAFGSRKCAWTPPAYANGHVFGRSEKELVCASLLEVK